MGNRAIPITFLNGPRALLASDLVYHTSRRIEENKKVLTTTIEDNRFKIHKQLENE